MMGEIETGTCCNCGKENVPVSRKYRRYGFKCECHSPEHFDMVRVCKDCENSPKFPVYTKISAKNPKTDKEQKFVLRADVLFAIKDTYNLCSIIDAFEYDIEDLLGFDRDKPNC